MRRRHYLIDTNIMCFLAEGAGILDKGTENILGDYANDIYISSECVCELIHLHQRNKIKIKRWKTTNDIIDFIDNEANIKIKYIEKKHLQTLVNLPLFPDHKDPNDRIIIAQAITDKIPLISSDRKFFHYEKYGLEFIYNER